MSHRAPTDHPVHDLVAERWSPVVFSPEPVEPATVHCLLEAARWAPSSYNEQPWRFVVGLRGDAAWQGVLEVLAEANARWAREAPVLMLSVASMRYARNDKPNRHAWHDVGLATATLLLEATARGLRGHPMGGFDAQRARERFRIPEGFEPVAALALGRHGDAARAEEDLARREATPRVRKPLEALVAGATWGEPPAALAP